MRENCKNQSIHIDFDTKYFNQKNHSYLIQFSFKLTLETYLRYNNNLNISKNTPHFNFHPVSPWKIYRVRSINHSIHHCARWTAPFTTSRSRTEAETWRSFSSIPREPVLIDRGYFRGISSHHDRTRYLKSIGSNTCRMRARRKTRANFSRRRLGGGRRNGSRKRIMKIRGGGKRGFEESGSVCRKATKARNYPRKSVGHFAKKGRNSWDV